MTEQNIKLRFCPSPTGRMHLGNARTALFNALYARKQGGWFLLRIEDTDQTRSSDEMADLLQKDLKCLGLDWQEGPEVEGEKGPYWQSKRQAIYDRYYEKLQATGYAYPCFCSEAQLALTRKTQRAAGKPPRYPGTCRSLTEKEIQEKLASGLKPTLRFRIPARQTVAFSDLVKGHQRFQTDDLGDFIIRRADGTAAFMYCNAIDDALMQVTHVLRGEDHLTNTPRQQLILQALNLPVPQYGHISLIVGPDNAPLSKRHGSRSIEELRELGFFPLALLNYMARLGHYYDSNEFMNIEQLAQGFDFKQLSSAPARFDAEQLNYWQKQAVLHVSLEDLWHWLSDDLKTMIPEDQRELTLKILQANVVFPADATQWLECFFKDKIEYDANAIAIMQKVEVAFFKSAIAAFEQHGSDYKAIVEMLKQETGLKGKALFQPLRLMLTGQLHGPEMLHICQLLGQKRLQLRAESVIAQFKE